MKPNNSKELNSSSQLEDPFEETEELHEYNRNITTSLVQTQTIPSITHLPDPTKEFTKKKQIRFEDSKDLAIQESPLIKSTKLIPFPPPDQLTKKKRTRFDISKDFANVETSLDKTTNLVTSPVPVLLRTSSLKSLVHLETEPERKFLLKQKTEGFKPCRKFPTSSRSFPDLDSADAPFKYLEGIKTKKLQDKFSELAKNSEKKKTAELGWSQSPRKKTIDINQISEYDNSVTPDRIIEKNNKEELCHSNLKPDCWVDRPQFQEMNLKFTDKFNIGNFSKNSFFSKFKAVKCKKKTFNNLQTVNQFKIECEEKKNEDIKHIVAKKNSSSKKEKDGDGNVVNYFHSIGFWKKPKIGNCVSIAILSPCSNFLAVAFNQSDVLVFHINLDCINDIFPKEQMFHLETPDNTKNVLEISWACDSQSIAAIFVDSKLLQVWQLSNPSLQTLVESDDIFLSIDFHTKSPDFLLTASFDHILRMWAVKDNKCVDWLKTADFITCIEFSPSGEFFVVGFLEGKFSVYEFKGRFSLIHTAAVKDLHYFNPKKDNSQKKDKKKKEGSTVKHKIKTSLFDLFSILFKKRLVNNKVVRILFPNKEKENEFLILNYSGQLKLISKEKNYLIIESFKSNEHRVPISIDTFSNYIIMNSEFGPTNLWKLNNYFIPVFNPSIFKSNIVNNRSVENYVPFKSEDSSDYFVSCFLSKEVVDKYNANHLKNKVEYFIVSVTCTGLIKLDRKLIKN